MTGVWWAYRNTPHESTGEKPSFLLFGIDCRGPTEAALFLPNPKEPVGLDDCREEVIRNLSSARELVLQESQRKSKQRYYRKTTDKSYKAGEWVLVKFPKEEGGHNRKLSQPRHGPFRVVSKDDPDLTFSKVYRPQDGTIQIHQSRIMPWPKDIVSRYFWYGRKQHSPGRLPKWLEQLSERERVADNGNEKVEGDSPDPEATATSESVPIPTEAVVDTNTPSELIRSKTGRYSLRGHIQPPGRFM